MNDFELVYYYLLNDEYAVNLFYNRFSRYLWGIIHRVLGKNASNYQSVYEECDGLLSEIVYCTCVRKCTNFKRFFALCARHKLTRYFEVLKQQQLNIMSDYSEEYAYQRHHYDYVDPRYNDRLVTCINEVKNVYLHKLSPNQQLVMRAYFFEDCAYMSNLSQKQQVNTMYHVRQKIKNALKNYI